MPTEKHYSKDGDPVLVWQAGRRSMNPSVPQSIIEAALEEDPARAGAEWLAQFRTDVESFVSREAVEACASVGVRERPPMSSVRYFGFCDPSGGSADAMALCIGHREGDVVTVDALRERSPPFSPQGCVEEFATLLKSYRVSKVTGHRYAGEWPREQFQKFGITYEPAAKPKSDLYRDALPLINSRKIDLLNDARLIGQLCSLERRTARGGRDSIDHAPGTHDDLANAVAGLAAAPAGGKYRYDSTLSWVSNDSDNAAEEFQRQRFQNHIRFYGGYFRRWG